MTDLVGELRSRRLVRELDPIRRPGAGRPTRPIALDGDPWCVIGAHIEVDKIQFLATTVGGTELWRDTTTAELDHAGAEAGFAIFAAALREQLMRLPADKALVAVEVGLPGYIARDGRTVGWSAGLDWRDLPLSRLIGEALSELGLEGVHVGVTNDAQLAALHASRVELAMPSNTVAVYLGGLRNVGSAVIIGGEIYRGASGGAGDFGHLNVDPSGPLHWCGRRGCLESIVGPQQLLTSSDLLSAREAEQLVNDQPRKAIQVITEAAASGDTGVLATLEHAGVALGRAIDDIIGIVNPDAVIIGGYLGCLSPYVLGPIEATISERIGIAAFAGTTVLALDQVLPRIVGGAGLAARDACLYDPLTLTRPMAY